MANEHESDGGGGVGSSAWLDAKWQQYKSAEEKHMWWCAESKMRKCGLTLRGALMLGPTETANLKEMGGRTMRDLRCFFEWCNIEWRDASNDKLRHGGENQ